MHNIGMLILIMLNPSEGGGYVARLPQFGISGIIGDGESAEEALADFQKTQKKYTQ